MDQSRRLRPIYDLLDSGLYSKAAKLCAKKDIAGIPIVQTLRALALCRSGHRDDGLVLCDTICQ